MHVWSAEWLGQGDWLDAVDQLKRDGKIRFFGVSINDHQPDSAIRLVESGLVDTVQVIYNVFDQTPEDELFPAVEASGVGVIVRVPFDEGALTGSVRPETTFPEGDFRNDYFAGERKREAWERVQAIARDLDVEVDGLAESRAPVLPQPCRDERRHPRHALDTQRRAKRARRRCRTTGGEPAEHAPSPSMARVVSADRPIRVTVWGENRVERTDPDVRAVYPDGMHEAIAGAIREHLGERAEVRTATLDEPATASTAESSRPPTC